MFQQAKNTKTLLLLTMILCQIQLLFSSEEKKDSDFFPYPIDIVYLWVDGSDPNWLSIKNQYLPTDQNPLLINEDACSENRFFDHEELRYSLRSLLKFAPFFNHIYIVTMNQRPFWMVDHPQITIIDHQEIFKNLENLPTFNSQAIECHLHLIPNLSEHFIYFNDDVFLGCPVSPYDFFTTEGKVKVLFEKGWTISPIPAVQDSSYRKAWVNSNALLDAHFIQERRHRLCHAPFALRKSFIENVETIFPHVFELNASHKFRTPQDYNLINGLLQYTWIYQDLAIRGTLSNKMLTLYQDLELSQNRQELDLLQKNPLDTFCIQDSMIGESRETHKLLKNFFETFLSDPAPWERAL